MNLQDVLTHVELGQPWLLLLLPAPVLIWWLLPPHRERQESVRVPFFEQVALASGRPAAPGAVVRRATVAQRLLAPLVWTLMVVALAQPQWVEDPIERIVSARDLMLAVDLSQSMDARDFTAPDGGRVDRLEAVKLVLDDFISRREGDRIGLVVFGEQAFLQAPFTLDHDTARALLDETRIGMAGPRTVIGDAIGLTVKVFETSEAPSRVLVLLTDGNDTGSRVPPSKAAEIAAREGITIYTIAIGDPEASGDNRVDLDALGAIADETGGRAFRAEDREGLEAIYRDLDSLEQADFETLSYRPKHPLFQWPLGVALVMLFAYHVLNALVAGVGALRARHA